MREQRGGLEVDQNAAHIKDNVFYHIRFSSAALGAAYRNVALTNKQIIFERACDGERVLVAVNADGAPYTAHFDAEMVPRSS